MHNAARGIRQQHADAPLMSMTSEHALRSAAWALWPTQRGRCGTPHVATAACHTLRGCGVCPRTAGALQWLLSPSMTAASSAECMHALSTRPRQEPHACMLVTHQRVKRGTAWRPCAEAPAAACCVQMQHLEGACNERRHIQMGGLILQSLERHEAESSTVVVFACLDVASTSSAVSVNRSGPQNTVCPSTSLCHS
jgi:hypothetical protein